MPRIERAPSKYSRMATLEQTSTAGICGRTGAPLVRKWDRQNLGRDMTETWSRVTS
jgi:hypothetical protein